MSSEEEVSESGSESEEESGSEEEEEDEEEEEEEEQPKTQEQILPVPDACAVSHTETIPGDANPVPLTPVPSTDPVPPAQVPGDANPVPLTPAPSTDPVPLTPVVTTNPVPLTPVPSTNPVPLSPQEPVQSPITQPYQPITVPSPAPLQTPDPSLLYLPDETQSHYSELTTGPVSAGLECPSCHRLIFDPYVLTCGHTLCSKCLRSCSVCPLDNKPFMTPVPNKQVEVFLKQTTTIRCKFGCGAQFTISQEEEHRAQCTHAFSNWWRLLQSDIQLTPTEGIETYITRAIPKGENCISFDVLPQGEFRVILNSNTTVSRGTGNKVYNFVLGKYSNKSTQLEFMNPGAQVVCTNTNPSALLQLNTWQSFWISFDNGYIVLGSGKQVGHNVLLAAYDEHFLECNHVGFSHYTHPATIKDIRCTNSPTWYHKCIRGVTAVECFLTPKVVFPYTEKNCNPWGININSPASVLHPYSTNIGVKRDTSIAFSYPHPHNHYFTKSECEYCFFVLGIKPTLEFTLPDGHLIPSVWVALNGVTSEVRPNESRVFTVMMDKGFPPPPSYQSFPPLMVATHFQKEGVALVVDHVLPQRATGIFRGPHSDCALEVRAALNFMVLTELGLPKLFMQHQIHCELKNFSNNNPLLLFQEPHWQFTLIKGVKGGVPTWREGHGAKEQGEEGFVCRFFLEKKCGGIIKNEINKITLESGQPCVLLDLIQFMIRPNGGLDIAIIFEGQPHSFSIVPDTTTFSSVRVRSGDFDIIRVMCQDDAQKGTFTSVVQPLRVDNALPLIKVYNYDAITGKLIHL